MKPTLFCLLLAAFPLAAQAQGTHSIKLLTPDTALKAAQAALKKCRDSGYQAAVAVVDRMGVTQVILRDRYAGAHTPRTARAPDRDAIVVSNGHVSPGVYAALAAFGFVTHDQVRIGFRRTGSAFAGHVESKVPGVEWNTGNLGQGLSAAVGAALARKLRGHDAWTYAVMGDGEQQKGQIGEARRFAMKFGLNRLVGIIKGNRFRPRVADGEFSDAAPVLVRYYVYD